MESRLIAHRGEPAHWPENSLKGFRAVLAAGACYVETDVQITADGVAVLSHDDSLLKMTGHDLAITKTTLADILELPSGCPERYGNRFADERIATLGELAALLAQWPKARAFIELKSDGILAFGVRPAVDLMLDASAGASAQCIPISFEYPALQYLRTRTELSIGWVLPAWNRANHRLADALAPEYLFVNRRHLPRPSEPLWSGPWRWVAYTANQTTDIRRLLTRGFDMIETDDIRRVVRELQANPHRGGSHD
ncbi:MAG: glycerophosphodiester phosphodiesterase family protein [Sedimenticolaceae bacterium]